MNLPFYTLDVFTDRIFGGNPLAVLPDARGLSTDQMQAIAREFNLSETVFLLPPDDPAATRRARIFTPASELPFAGHPTIGTAWLLAELGEGDRSTPGSVRILLEENVGPVPIDVTLDGDGHPAMARLRAAGRLETRPCDFSAADLADLLSLDPADLAVSPAPGADPPAPAPARVPVGPSEAPVPPLPPAFSSAGVPFLFVPLRGLDAVRRARVNLPVFERLMHGAWGHEVCVFSTETESPDVDLHVRMFAPGLGIAEDPATGAAAAALAVLLAERVLAPAGLRHARWIIEQGIEMQRPSRLIAEAELDSDAAPAAVYVAGQAVRVSEGRLTLPDPA